MPIQGDGESVHEWKKQLIPVVVAAVLGSGGGIGYSELKPKSDSMFTAAEKVQLTNDIATLKNQMEGLKEVNPALINEKLNNMKEQLNRIERYANQE